MSLSGLVPGTDGLYALPVNLMFGIFPLLLLASPFLPKNKAVIYLSFLSCLVFNVLILYGVAGNGWRLPVRFYGSCAVCLSAFYALYCVVSLWGYVRRVRNVVQKTTIWTMLSVSVDAVYVFFMTGLSMAFYIGTDSPPRVSVWIVSLTVMQLWLTMAALVYRISTDSLFFIMRKHEMIILESLNDVPGDMARGRMEGLVYAERIVSKDGIEGLREEIKKRGCSGVSINVSHKEMEKATSQMRNMMLDTVMSMSMGILHDKFGFGHDRLQKFMDAFQDGAELLNDGVITWQQIIDNTEEVTGIHLTLRRNDQNVQIKRQY